MTPDEAVIHAATQDRLDDVERMNRIATELATRDAFKASRNARCAALALCVDRGLRGCQVCRDDIGSVWP